MLFMNRILPILATFALLPLTCMAGLTPGTKNLGAIWFIGDSITQSNADNDPNGSPRKSLHDLLTTAGYTFTYTGHFTANPDGLPKNGDTPESNLYQFHTGISGSVIGDNAGGRAGITQNLPKFWTQGRLATVKPNVILIMLGTNDINSNIDVTTAPERLSKLLDTIYAQPGVGSPTILLASIPPNRTNPAATERTAAFNAKLPALVKEQRDKGRDIFFVDQFTPLDANYATVMRSDNLHPIAAGNTSLAKQWFTKIEEIVKSPASR